MKVNVNNYRIGGTHTGNSYPEIRFKPRVPPFTKGGKKIRAEYSRSKSPVEVSPAHSPGPLLN